MYHLVGFILGFILDMILGDPYCFWHPIRSIGALIGKLDIFFLGSKENPKELSDSQKRARGVWLVFLVCSITTIISGVILFVAYKIHIFIGVLVETIMTYQMLATKCLKVESMKVHKQLVSGSLEDARKAVSMIVGRDTASLSMEGVAKAAVETVAENTSDGSIAPMIYLAIGGPVLGFLYKSINTMDSMVGYKNDRYMDFGRCAAKLDDVVNFIPARISGLLIVLSAFLLGKDYSGKDAFRIFKRDRFNHASPNSAQTESACAGALGLQLAGPASYFGKVVEKPYIGDAKREIIPDDIRKANALLYMSALLCFVISNICKILIIMH